MIPVAANQLCTNIFVNVFVSIIRIVTTIISWSRIICRNSRVTRTDLHTYSSHFQVFFSCHPWSSLLFSNLTIILPFIILIIKYYSYSYSDFIYVSFIWFSRLHLNLRNRKNKRISFALVYVYI